MILTYHSISLREMLPPLSVLKRGGVSMAQFQLRLPTELRELLRRRAEKMGVSMNALILQALWAFIDA